jgi:hypothetical protein
VQRLHPYDEPEVRNAAEKVKCIVVARHHDCGPGRATDRGWRLSCAPLPFPSSASWTTPLGSQWRFSSLFVPHPPLPNSSGPRHAGPRRLEKVPQMAGRLRQCSNRQRGAE